MRIRHYGLLANRVRKQNLEHCRRLIGDCTAEHHPVEACQINSNCKDHSTTDWPCPKCRHGEMRFVELLPPKRAGPIVA